MSIVTDEDLNDEFGMFGTEIDNSNVLDKLKELCTIHRLNASEVAAEWVAYEHSNHKVKLNLEVLDSFERERLSKRSMKTPKTARIKKTAEPVIYDINTIQQGMEETAAEELYNAYSTPSSKGKMSQKRQHTPEAGPIKRFTGLNHSPVIPFSPASMSPAGKATPSRKYGSRTNAGEVLQSFGVVDNVNWQGQGDGCSIVHYDSSHALQKGFKYMFQKLTEKAQILNDMIEDMAIQLQQHYGIEDWSHVGLPTQEEVTVCGRVCCDSDGKLNAKSLVLEGSRETSAGKSIAVDLSELAEYSLFPGQVVALNGVNITGQKLVAKKVYKGIPMPLPNIDIKTESGRLHAMIAAGPFTTSDSIAYEPLADLLKCLQRDKPDVCLLLGPFVDIRNEEIEEGNIGITYAELFMQQIEQVIEVTEKAGCQVVIVPSYRDVHHDVVYPQPPFKMSRGKATPSHVHFVTDPSTLVINNTVFGLTSTDILFHLGAEEISSPPGSADRLGRLVQHLVNQQSYYPLYPPSEEVLIDYEQFEIYGRMPITPHILLVPSDLRYFIKSLNGCCCINPGRVAKGQIGGTFVRMVVKSGAPDPKTGALDMSVQVVRV